MWIDASFRQLVTSLNHLFIQHFHSGTIGNQISFGIAVFCVCHHNLPLFLGVLNGDNSSKLRDNSQTFWLSGLKQLFHTGKTLCNIATSHAACMECTHGQLSSRLTNGLSRNNSNGLAYLNWLSGSHIGSVTLGTNPDVGFAGQHSTNLHRIPALFLQNSHNLCRPFGITHMIRLYNHLSCIRVCDRLCNISTGNPLLKALDSLFSICKSLDFHKWNFLALAAVYLTNNQILRHIHQTSGQIT